MSGETGLAEGGWSLPDEEGDGRLKFGPGGLDGIFGRHGGAGRSTDRAEAIHAALKGVLEDDAATGLMAFYEQLVGAHVIEYVDPLLGRISAARDLDPRRLGALARWLALNAPHREPVKLGIALSGLLRDLGGCGDLMPTLGRHEEFTLYVAVALTRSGGERAEAMLFDLARHVDGWGRIQIVQRLAGSRDDAIKAWMLREGYRNAVMHEYLAYTCAVAGDLRAALEQDEIDRPLLDGASEIIRALLVGGPAEDMDDYADGAFVVERFLDHLGPQPDALGFHRTADGIQRFLECERADWAARAERGWTPERRSRLVERVRALTTSPHWAPMIDLGLGSGDRDAFCEAWLVATSMGLDPWDRAFARLEAGRSDGWHFVMQTDDPRRIDRVVELAERTLPLGALASGPTLERGLGPQGSDDSALGCVLRDLRRFPGTGWRLIHAGMRNPVVRNRAAALGALSAWPREAWPAEGEAALRAALHAEPAERLRERIERLLTGPGQDTP